MSIAQSNRRGIAQLNAAVLMLLIVVPAASQGLPDGFSRMPVAVGEGFRELELVGWRGRPLIDPRQRTLPAPDATPGCTAWRCKRGYHYRESLQYFWLLGLIKHYAEKPEAFQPTLERSDPTFLNQLARSYLPDGVRGEFVNCPQVTNPHLSIGAHDCAPKNLGIFSHWAADDEFEAEDKVLAFAKRFEPVIASAHERVPLRFWLAYPVTLSEYRFDEYHENWGFKFSSSTGNAVPTSTPITRVFGPGFRKRLWYRLPQRYATDEAGARALLRELGGRSAYLVADLELEREAADFDPELFLVDLKLRSMAMYQSKALKRRIESYRYE